ncbi:MAG: 2-hydroxyacid dehydrogenase [Candidatus Bathyarchaeota archaeon]
MSPEFMILFTSSNKLFLHELEQRLPGNCRLIVPPSLSEPEILPLIGDVDIIVGTRVSGNLISSAGKLKMIQTVGTGVDGIAVDAATQRGVVVCSAVGLNAVPVAEYVLTLMLALAKNIIKNDRKLRDEGWLRTPSILMENKTLGIVGLGSIGLEVAERAKAFKMRILAIKRNPSEDLKRRLGLDFLGSQDDLPYLLREADFVLLSVVLTPETKKLIGERELRLMKKTAYLVNISRGNVIDEHALIKVLQDGAIAGAGLDVFEAEPINRDNPLLTMQNVILSPHTASGVESEEALKQRAVFVAKNIERLTRGQPPEKVVDPVLKYVLD